MPTIELEFALHPKQSMAFTTHATEVLYGGSAGSGKSYLLRVALVTWCLQIPGLQCYLFRLHQDEITRSHVDGDSGFRAILQPLIAAGAATVLEKEVRIGPSRIYLCHCNQTKDLNNYYSTEMHVLVVEEATQLRESWLRILRTRCRMSSAMKEKLPAELRDRFPRILYATNPIGESQAYFRKQFVKAAPPFQIYKANRLEGGMLRQYIPARLEDNPSLNADEYSSKLHGTGDAALTDALLQGNWDALAGDFLREYDDDVHSVPSFIPPDHWFKFRTFDWGHAEPFVCQWWSVSDGESFQDHLSHTRWFPAGALVMYREWYGCNPDNTAQGLRMTNEDMARGIVQRTPEKYNWVTVTDSKPFQSTGAVKGLGTAEVFANNGVMLVQGDTGRVNGWMQLRSRLRGGDTGPMIYFCDCCTATREYLPALQRHELKPDDAAESGEATHCCLIGDTLVKTINGSCEIQNLIADDFVIAGDGTPRKISAAGLTRKQAKVIKLRFSDSSTITCTPDHKILTTAGWVEACDVMRYACIIGACESTSFQQQFKSLTAENTRYTAKRNTSLAQGIDSTELCGNTPTAQCPRASTYTTKTTTAQTIKSRIWSYFTAASIYPCIIARLKGARVCGQWLTSIGLLPKNGTDQKRGLLGTQSTIRSLALSSYIERLSALVSIAARNLLEYLTPRIGFAQLAASVNVGELPTGKIEFAHAAESNSTFTKKNATPAALCPAQQLFAGVTVRCLSVESAEPVDVYCLTEPATHSFQLASGLIVRNCDAVRYSCTSRPMIKQAPPKDEPFVYKPKRATFDDMIKLSRMKQRQREYADRY